MRYTHLLAFAKLSMTRVQWFPHILRTYWRRGQHMTRWLIAAHHYYCYQYARLSLSVGARSSWEYFWHSFGQKLERIEQCNVRVGYAYGYHKGELLNIPSFYYFSNIWGHALSIQKFFTSNDVRRGERVILLCTDNLQFLGLLLGCFCAGVIAVPAYPPDPSKLAESVLKMKYIVSDCQAKICIVDSQIYAYLKLSPSLYKNILETGVSAIFSYDESMANFVRVSCY